MYHHVVGCSNSRSRSKGCEGGWAQGFDWCVLALSAGLSGRFFWRLFGLTATSQRRLQHVDEGPGFGRHQAAAGEDGPGGVAGE